MSNELPKRLASTPLRVCTRTTRLAKAQTRRVAASKRHELITIDPVSAGLGLGGAVLCF